MASSALLYRTLDNQSLVTSEVIDLTGGTDGDVVVYDNGTAVPGGSSTGRLGTLEATTVTATTVAATTVSGTSGNFSGAVTAGTYDFTVTNVGGGAGVFNNITGKDVELRTIPLRTNTILASVFGNVIELDARGESLSITIDPVNFSETDADDWVWISPGTSVTTTSGVFTVFDGDSTTTPYQTTPNADVFAVMDDDTQYNRLYLRCPFHITPTVSAAIDTQWALDDAATAPRTAFTIGVRFVVGIGLREDNTRSFTSWAGLNQAFGGGYAGILDVHSLIGLGFGTTIPDNTANLMIQVYHNITVARYPTLTPGDYMRFMYQPNVYLNFANLVLSSSQTTGLLRISKTQNV